MSFVVQSVVECVICYDPLESSTNKCTTPCGHIYCMSCFVKCMQNSNCCSICRKELYEVNEEEESESEQNSDSETLYTETTNDNDTSSTDYNSLITIEAIYDRFVKEGLTMKDLVVMMYYDTRTDDPKYTSESRKTMNETVDNIIEKLEDEAESEEREREDMENEDTPRDRDANIKENVVVVAMNTVSETV